MEYHRLSPMLPNLRSREHATDSVSHVLITPDMNNAQAEPYNQSTTGCQHSLRFKFPVVIHSSYHIVHGPAHRVMSDSKWILYFHKYRPHLRPKMYWLEERRDATDEEAEEDYDNVD